MLTFLIFIGVLSILIVVHEFGHFLAARWVGVKVEKFAIGFGPPLVKIKRGETQFLICLFPLGGYVKLAGESRSELKGLDYEFLSRKPGVRAGVIFFGPFFNFILAFFIFWIIFAFITGFPSSEPVVGKVMKYGPVVKSEFSQQEWQKLRENGIIEEVDGNNKEYISWMVSKLEEEELRSLGFKDNEIKHILHIWQNSFKMTLKNEFAPGQLQQLLEENIVKEEVAYWNVASEEELKAKLSKMETLDSEKILAILQRSYYPAYKVGIKEGDKILEVNGEKVNSWEEIQRLIRISTVGVNLTILRGSQRREIAMVPQKMTVKDISGEKRISFIGIGSKVVRGEVILSFLKAFEKMCNLTQAIIKGFLLLLTRQVPFREAVAGPIGIGVLTARMARIGILPLLDFMGMLSLSLGIINLFPFPVLDGGHLFFMLIEKIRGRPLSQRLEEAITRFALGILIILMVFISYNDIVKFGSRGGLTIQELQKLKEGGMVQAIEDNEKYVFWTDSGEKEVALRLSKTRIPNPESILTIWRNSPKVTEVLAND